LCSTRPVTLTRGQLTLAETIPVRGTAETALALAAALEQGSEHPVARALQAATEGNEIIAQALRATAGAGMAGTIDGREWRLGRPDFVGALHSEALPDDIIGKVGDGDT